MKRREFEIACTTKQADRYHTVRHMTLGELKKRFKKVSAGDLLMGFMSSKDADDYCVTLDLLAPASDDQKPWTQFVLWHGNDEVFSQVVELGVIDELEFVVNGEAINLVSVIASEAMLEKALHAGGLSQLIPAG